MRWKVTRRRFRRLLPGYVFLSNISTRTIILIFNILTYQNKENEAKEELKRRAKQLEIQRREMTRRGQDPYSTNSGGFNTKPTYPSSSAYVPPRSANFSQAEADRQVPEARPFKSRGMMLGGKKKVGMGALEEALGGEGLGAQEPLLRPRDDSPIYAQDTQQQQQQRQRQIQPQQAKMENPFGPVDEAE